MIYITQDGKTIRITNIPRHIKPVLMVGEGNEVTKVASFDSEEAAQRFIHTFEQFVTIDKGR